MSIWGMGVMIGPIMGPTLGGWLTDAYSWRWVFYINLPFGIATVLGLAAFMRESEANTRLSFDWLGFAALSIAIGALQLMLDRGEQAGWFDATEIVLMAAISAVAFYIFITHTVTTPHPFISVEIFANRNFVIGLLFMFVCGVLLVASMALMAPFLQNVLGYPIIDAGLLLGTRGIGMMIAMLVAGRLAPKLDPRLVLLAGLLLCTVSLYYTIDFGPDTSVFTIVWVSVVQGLGLGCMFVPLNVLALSTLTSALRTEGTAIWTLIRNLGSSIGVSVVIANLTNTTTTMHARLMENVTPFNQALADPAAAMLDLSTDTGRALMEQLVTQQATIIAYANDFKLMMVMTLFAYPLILLIRTQQAAPALEASAPASAH
jgi:DHA2 family multidrug resistance protein